MIGLSQVRVLSANIRHPRSKFSPDEGASDSDGSAGDPGTQDQTRSVHLLGHYIWIDENSGTDNASHHDHGSVEEPQLTCQHRLAGVMLGFVFRCGTDHSGASL